MTAGSAPGPAAALYDARITHIRPAGIRRAFTHRLYLWLVDLDALPDLPWWLRPFARFRAADHLGPPDRTIRANLDGWLAHNGVDLAGGRVLMLAHARVAGYVFNPITLFWCHRPDGTLACVVAEVHNTYGELHCYLLEPDRAGRASAAKRLYVSPFLAPDGDYLMRVPEPGRQLTVTIALRQQGAVTLTALLRGTRRPATRRTLLQMVLARPLTPLVGAALIRLHGITLWARRLPIAPRTPHRPQEGTR